MTSSAPPIKAPGPDSTAAADETSWPDTQPCLFRSEAFYEDLEVAPPLAAQFACAAAGGRRGGLNEAWVDLVRAADAVFGNARLGRQGA